MSNPAFLLKLGHPAYTVAGLRAVTDEANGPKRNITARGVVLGGQSERRVNEMARLGYDEIGELAFEDGTRVQGRVRIAGCEACEGTGQRTLTLSVETRQ